MKTMFTMTDTTAPETLRLGTTGGWKAEYRLLNVTKMTNKRFAYDVASNLRRKYGWRVKVKKFGDTYYFYKKTDSRSRY